MASIKQLAQSLGLSGTVSLLGDFLGFFRRRVPTDPTGARVVISLKRQAQLLQGDHFNLNVIAIGADNFTDTEDNELDYSIYRMRNIYSQVNIGVGRVQHYGVDTADAAGLDAPTDTDHLEEITDRWTVPNDGIDLFFPLNINVPGSTPGSVILGQSPRPGPCQSKDSKGMNGSVSGLWGDEQTSRTSSHEIGHYLDLSHRNSEPDNLMCQSGSANSVRDSVDLTNGQGNTAKGHCLMNGGL